MCPRFRYDKVAFSADGLVKPGRGCSASIKLGSMLGRPTGCHGLPLTASPFPSLHRDVPRRIFVLNYDFDFDFAVALSCFSLSSFRYLFQILFSDDILFRHRDVIANKIAPISYLPCSIFSIKKEIWDCDRDSSRKIIFVSCIFEKLNTSIFHDSLIITRFLVFYGYNW